MCSMDLVMLLAISRSVESESLSKSGHYTASSSEASKRVALGGGVYDDLRLLPEEVGAPGLTERRFISSSNKRLRHSSDSLLAARVS